MLLAYGFLRKVFEVFEAWKTPIDMIATSEVAVSLTIDCTEHLEEIRKQEETLQKLNAKTWGVEFVQDGNRKFLVLPYGKSAEVIPFQGKEWVHLKE